MYVLAMLLLLLLLAATTCCMVIRAISYGLQPKVM
jgi:hypothetical protein